MLDSVSDHRRHHKLRDKEGDPHSPWRSAADLKALTKGLAWAHMGWLFDRELTTHQKFWPDWLTDTDIRAEPPVRGAGRGQPARPDADCRPLDDVLAGRGDRVLLGRAGPGVLPASRHLVDQLDLSHVGKRAFKTRDKSRNVGLAGRASFGESWHNLHHADPTCARHGVLQGQIDIAARGIWLAEKLRAGSGTSAGRARSENPADRQKDGPRFDS